MAQRIGHAEQGGNAIDQGCQGAHGDEGIHIGRLVPQGFQAPAVIDPVQVHHRQRQHQLQQRGNYGIFRAVVPVGLRQAHHVTHGKVHQHTQKGEGADDPLLHFLQGIVSRRFLLLFLFSRQAGTIARLGDCLDDRLHNRIRFCGNHHGAAQQIHLRLFHTGNLFCHLFHSGRAGGTGHSRNGKLYFHKATTFPKQFTNCSAIFALHPQYLYDTIVPPDS